MMILKDMFAIAAKKQKSQNGTIRYYNRKQQNVTSILTLTL